MASSKKARAEVTVLASFGRTGRAVVGTFDKADTVAISHAKAEFRARMQREGRDVSTVKFEEC